MKKELEVYVPQILLDVGRELLNDKNTETQRFQYRTRLEAARDYCNEMLAKAPVRQTRDHTKGKSYFSRVDDV